MFSFAVTHNIKKLIRRYSLLAQHLEELLSLICIRSHKLCGKFLPVYRYAVDRIVEYAHFDKAVYPSPLALNSEQLCFKRRGRFGSFRFHNILQKF